MSIARDNCDTLLRDPGSGGRMTKEGDLGSTEAKLARARLFIRKAYGEIDPELPEFLRVLEEAGAAECWHKHGTFFEHLHNVYRNLKLWGVDDAVARCGLFHSAYSNSYVNLAIFEPDVGRQRVRDLIGPAAEELVHWFCVVPRQQLIFDVLLAGCANEDLLRGRKAGGALVPPEGVEVKHIRTGEPLLVPRRLVAVFLILTIADFSDQWFGWQDYMFGNEDGTMSFQEDDAEAALWPGDGRPGLWMPAISRMGLLLNRILSDEEEYMTEERRHGRGDALKSRPFAELELEVLPILNRCTVLVSPAETVRALNLYWEAVCAKGRDREYAKAALANASRHNAFLAEPHVVLAQVHCADGEWEDARREASEGLRLLLEWGTHWDKRMTWEGWISWARVLATSAAQKTWPKTGFGVLNLGLVK